MAEGHRSRSAVCVVYNIDLRVALVEGMQVGKSVFTHQLTRYFTLRHGLASVAGHRRLSMQDRKGKGGGHAFAALSVGSRRVVNNRNVI